jgi:acyl carrier protein
LAFPRFVPQWAETGGCGKSPRRKASFSTSAAKRRMSALREIWSKSLKIDDVGIDDNFLDLGGDSLLAGQMVLRCRETLGLDLQLRTIFEHPTIRALASFCKRAAAGADNLSPDSFTDRSRQRWHGLPGAMAVRPGNRGIGNPHPDMEAGEI